MIKFSFPSLEKWIREDASLSPSQKMKFTARLKHLAVTGTDDLFQLITRFKRDYDTLMDLGLYRSIIAYWEAFQSVVRCNTLTDNTFPAVRFLR